MYLLVGVGCCIYLHNDVHHILKTKFADGYVLLPGVVEKPLVDKALRAINCSLGRNVPNRQQM
jgi:hypothetical protein